MVDSKQTPGSKPIADYSELPQKPITLKKDIGGLVRPAGEEVPTAEHESSTPAVARQKKTASTRKKSSANGQWTLRGISSTAREAATQAARQEGLKLSEWMERAIYQSIATSPSQQEPTQPVIEALEDIRSRLERIELQSGFFYRIWQRIKQSMG